MKLNIRGEKTEITQAMMDYAKEKIGKLEKYIAKNENANCNILFKVNGPKQKIEITIPLKNCTLRVEEEGKDFYSAIDVSIDKLERQIIKNKTRLNNKKNKERIDIVLDFDIDYEEENKDQIVKRKTVELKPMDEEEAILQMELTNHDFYIFKNVETDNIAVVYKRKNNNYGIIEGE